MRKRWLAFVLVVSSTCSAQTRDPVATRGVFVPGEELCYVVRWNFVRLGEIVIRTSWDTSCSSADAFKLSMVVKSNPDLPFIWIQEDNESFFDAAVMNSKRFRARHRNGDDYYEVTQIHDDIRRTMIYRRTDLNTGKIIRTDTLRDVGNYVEGPSLFFAARSLSRFIGKQSVSTLIEGRLHTTEIHTDGTTEEISIDALDYPVRTRLLTGFAHWTGGSSAGISGEFIGWMSDDAAAVPIKAEMKILLGSITLELEKWIHPGWRAPYAQSAERME